MEFLTDPVAWWLEPFTSYGFMRYALAAGLLTAAITSMVGTWIVLRGTTFLGDALAHGALPGIALAFVLGWSTTLGAFTAAIAMVAGVHLVQSRSPLPADSAIGVLFVGFLALAVVIVSSGAGSYTGDLTRFLFGSITGVDRFDLARLAVAALLCLVLVAVFYRAFLAMTFDEAQAQLLGLRPRLANAVLLVLLAISIVSSFEVVGSLLVFAFLVAPPAAAAMLVRRVPLIIAAATGIGSLAVVLGLLISYHQDVAPGATMALLAVTAFLLSVAFRGRNLWQR